MLIAAASQSFLDDCRARALSAKTQSRYLSDLDSLRRFLATRAMDRLEQCSVETLRAYFCWLLSRANRTRKGTQLSPFTVAGMYRSVKTFFMFCHTEHYINFNPMTHVRSIKLPKRLVPRLSEEQVTQLIGLLEHTESPERNLAYFFLLVDSGLRRGEALGLKLSDVDLTKGWAKVIGKGNKERVVPLGSTTCDVLRGYLASRMQHNGCDRMFVCEDGSPWQADGVRSLFKRLRKKMDVQRLYPHLLRHTFAKLFLLRSHDAKALQTILGHARASTTLDLYVDYSASDLTKIHRRYSPVDHLVGSRQRRKTKTR